MTKRRTFYDNLFRGIKQRINKAFSNPYSKININWFYLKYLKHLPAGKIHAHNLFNHKTFFYGGPEYLHGLKEIFIEGVYNQDLPENAFILDCGAHIGLSVIYLKRICPSANIIAFEPDVENYSLLEKNVAAHQLKGIDLKQEAVWTGNTILNFLQEGSMGSKIATGTASNTREVKAIRLKDYLNKKVDFLKLDIEGAEYEVLKDIEENLDYVSKMFIEYHGTFSQNNELLRIFEMIVNAGFRFYIKEASNIYDHPFMPKQKDIEYDIQLNIFCLKG